MEITGAASIIPYNFMVKEILSDQSPIMGDSSSSIPAGAKAPGILDLRVMK
jgi:hypothetical protein